MSVFCYVVMLCLSRSDNDSPLSVCIYVPRCHHSISLFTAPLLHFHLQWGDHTVPLVSLNDYWLPLSLYTSATSVIILNSLEIAFWFFTGLPFFLFIISPFHGHSLLESCPIFLQLSPLSHTYTSICSNLLFSHSYSHYWPLFPSSFSIYCRSSRLWNGRRRQLQHKWQQIAPCFTTITATTTTLLVAIPNLLMLMLMAKPKPQ